MATIVHNRPNNRNPNRSFESVSLNGGLSKTGLETTNFDISALNNSTLIGNSNNYSNDLEGRRGKPLPKLNFRSARSRENKMYRAPPTPPPDKLIVLERAFTLDCIAVGNISEDYSIANPKLGSAIPPYDSRNDPAVKNYMKNYGIDDLLRRTKQLSVHESIPGKVHDKFFSSGLGADYLNDRNKFGNGHNPENFEGHRRYLGDRLTEVFSYNNQNGYRRNVPHLRNTPSTFLPDKKQMMRISQSFQNHYKQEEIRNHLQNTFVSGFPFCENDYKEFFPAVRYFVTIKVGEHSPATFLDTLNINIVAKSYATGFIKLDKSLAFLGKTKDERAKSIASKSSASASVDESKVREKLKLFQSGKEYVFVFEDKDIRTISGVILAKEGKQDLYIDEIVLEIHKAKEKKIFRFPYDGYVNSGKQAKKAEDVKKRFGIQNSVYAVPNEYPNFEYGIKTTPQLFSKAEYVTKIECDVEDENAPCQYRISLYPSHLPSASTVSIKLIGEAGSTDFIRLSDHKLVLRERDIGKVKSALISYDKRPTVDAPSLEWFIESIAVTKDSSESFVFNLNKNFRPQEKILHKVDHAFELTPEEKEKNQRLPVFSGKLSMVIEGDKSLTNAFNLSNYILSSDKKSFTFKTYSTNVGAIQGVNLKFTDKPGCICKIKSIKVSRHKDIFEYNQLVEINNDSEMYLPEGVERQKYNKSSSRKPAQLLVKLVGEKNSTDYFTLDNPTPGSNDSDNFIKISRDIGKLNNVHLKYQSNDKRSVFIESIEITNPKGEKFSFPIEESFKSGDESILPKSETSDHQERKTQNNSTMNQTFQSKTPNHTSFTTTVKDGIQTPTVTNTSPNTTLNTTTNVTSNPTPETSGVDKSGVKSTTLSSIPSATKSPSKTPTTTKTPNETQTKSPSKTQNDTTKSSSPEVEMIDYHITTKTGNNLLAGTESNVYIIINGESASTKETLLSSLKAFEKGTTDTFTVKAENVGKVKSIKIRQDNGGFSGDWYLESVDVATRDQKITFPCDKWIQSSSNASDAITLTPRAKSVENNVLKALSLDLNDEE